MPQPPRPREEPRVPAATGAGAAGAGATGAAVAPAPAGAVLSAEAIRKTTEGVLAALRAFWGNGNDDIFWLWQQLKKRYPAEPEDDLRRLAQLEADYGKEFRRRMAVRLERDVPRALQADDPKATLRMLLERERRYIRQRQEAMIARSISTLERASLKRTSPGGAYWRLSPFVKEHTIDCLVMAGKWWPWEVLDVIHPPRHAGCPCELLGAPEAIEKGLLPHSFTPPPPEEAIALANELRERYAELREAMESAPGESEFENRQAELEYLIDGMENERLALSEAAYDKRYAKGTVKGGEYMPKVGGYADKVKADLVGAVKNLLAVGKGRGRGSMRRHGGLATVPQKAPTAAPVKAKDFPHAHLPGGMGPGEHVPPTPHSGGAPPANFEEFRGRVDAGVQEAADEFGAKRVFLGIQVNPNEPDTMAMRWWNGQAEIGNEAGPNIEQSAAAQEGTSNAVAASKAWLTYSRAAHEGVGHGVNPISPADYSTPEGYTLDEALAEEVGRDHGARWLAADGHTDALAWAKANSTHPRAVGAYQIERARLGAVMEEAGVPEDSRRALVETLAFRQGHAARMNLLGGLVSAKTGLPAGEAQERVRATLTGERDEELGVKPEGDHRVPLLEAGAAPSPPKAGVEPTDTGGVPSAPESGAQEPQMAPADKPAPESGAVALKTGSGPLFFDARHYSDPRRALLQKMNALPEGKTLELADGATVKRGPKGSFRFTRPDGENKLYSTPQRAVNAETVGALSRHGIADERLDAARAAAGISAPQNAPADFGSANELSAAMRGGGETLQTPAGPAVITEDEGGGWEASLPGGERLSDPTASGLAEKLFEPGSRIRDREAIYADANPQYAPADTSALQTSLIEKPPADVLGIPSYSPETVGLTDFKAAGGSNGAQFAKDKNGDPWLMKAYNGNTDRVATELLANAVYRELGISVPEAGQYGGEPDFSNIPDTLEEPPLPELPLGKEQSTGMVVLEPDGSVWVFEPKDHFGGYEHTFSKGRLETGLTPQQNARKELYEELGMRANPVGVLGDYEGDVTSTRFYVARRTSDQTPPTGGETESVKRLRPTAASQALNKPRDQKILADALAQDWPTDAGADFPPDPGTPKLAYPLVDGKTERWDAPNQQLGEGFMADALLANWDVVGLEQDNVLWGEDGTATRVDQGGTFEFRAMGGEKPYGPVPTEAWTMRSPKGQAFGRYEMSDEMLKDQAGDIHSRLTPERVDELIDSTPFADEEMRERVRENLKSRVDFMGKVAAGTEELPGPLVGPEANLQLESDAKRLGGLFPEEEAAIEHLLNTPEVDDHLRSGAPKDQASLAVQGSVEQLDALLGQARTSEDLTVYMPIGLEALGVGAGDIGGKRFREKGYLQASTDEGAAGAAGKAILRVLVPAGAHALGLDGLSTEPGAVVFRRGSQVRIAGVSHEGGMVYVDAVLS